MSVSRSQLEQWDREVLWHAFTQMAEYEPLLIERAEGCQLIDVDGQRYLDGVSSLWCNVHGHRHPRLDQAIRDQLDRVAHVTLLGLSTPTTVELAGRLVELAPGDLNHVFFSSDGSSAVEVGLKLAFQYWRQCPTPEPQRTHFVALGDAYHGDTLGSVSVGGVARFHAMFEPLLFEVERIPGPRMVRLPDGVTPESAAEYYLATLEQHLRQRPEQWAAVVLEPLVQCAAGIITHPPGFLRGVRELTRRYGTLLILDEVAVGFGRTGSLFACQQEEVIPDLLCLGKGLTAGYLPMAATLASDRIWEAFLGRYEQSRTFFHGHTYSGNALAAAVALESLNVFRDERVLEQLPEKIEAFRRGLERLAELEHVGDVRQQGLIAGVELVRDRATNEPFPWEEQRGQQVCRTALRHGVWIRPLGNVVVLMPPLAVTTGQIQQLVAAVEAGIRELA